MYTRRFRGRDIQIPKDYRGTAFDEKEEEYEETIKAEDQFDPEAENHPSPLPDAEEVAVHTTEHTNAESDSCSSPCEDHQQEEQKEKSIGILSHLGLGDMEFSDILLLLLVVLLMKEQDQDTDLPILLLLLLLS